MRTASVNLLRWLILMKQTRQLEQQEFILTVRIYEERKSERRVDPWSGLTIRWQALET